MSLPIHHSNPINETGLAGYSFVDITGDAECPSVLGGNVSPIALNQTVSCTITNDDISPTITLNKIVTNDDGGSSGVNDFGLSINGTAVNSGQTLNVTANTPFPINETGLAGYSFVDITGDAECPSVLGGNVSPIALNQTVSCTITNDDLPPAMMTLTKIVINDDIGSADVNDFGLTINGTAVNSGQTLNVTANTPFPINETGLAGYSFVDITGDAECPSILGGNVSGMALGDTVTCTITNDDMPDTEKPVITPIGVNATIPLGSTYMELGGTVTDNDPAYSEVVTVGGDTVNTLVLGDYTITYNAPADASGNLPDEKSITISVEQITITIDDVTQVEGDTGSSNFIFAVTRSSIIGAISVQYQTFDGTAISPTDYTSISVDTLNFTDSGPKILTISVPVNGDVDEETPETFFVNLTNCNGCVIIDTPGLATILDDDSSGSPNDLDSDGIPDTIDTENIITSSTTISSHHIVANVTIQNGIILTIPNGLSITITAGNNLTVELGGGAFIESGGTLIITP